MLFVENMDVPYMKSHIYCPASATSGFSPEETCSLDLCSTQHQPHQPSRIHSVALSKEVLFNVTYTHPVSHSLIRQKIHDRKDIFYSITKRLLGLVFKTSSVSSTFPSLYVLLTFFFLFSPILSVKHGFVIEVAVKVKNFLSFSPIKVHVPITLTGFPATISDLISGRKYTDSSTQYTGARQRTLFTLNDANSTMVMKRKSRIRIRGGGRDTTTAGFISMMATAMIDI
jgi:hypothetical protein